jgi:hypothetical protein
MPPNRVVIVLLHLLVGLIHSQGIVDDAVNGRHFPGAMPASSAVDKDRPVLWIIDELEKMLRLLVGCGLPAGKGNIEVLHACVANPCRFHTISVLAEIDGHFYSQLRQFHKFSGIRLCATIIVLVDMARIVDVDARASFNLRAFLF